VPSRSKLVLVAGVVTVIAALVGLLAWRLSTEEQAKGLIAAVGRGEKPEAPDFTLPVLGSDEELQLSSLRGSAVVLNVWASWCDPCREEAPALQDAHERWSDQGVVVLGVDYQDATDAALAFVDEHGLTYQSVRDGSGSVLAGYGVTGVPETFFIDREGRIVDYVSGPIDLDSLDQRIEDTLAS
jgi:cytochrome c biogenesis protein CcmG/thiol:disulfide interchange protein DsbE